MLELITANLGTIAVFLVLAVVVGLIIRSLYKQKKRGGSCTGCGGSCTGCGGSCGSCGGCTACHARPPKS